MIPHTHDNTANRTRRITQRWTQMTAALTGQHETTFNHNNCRLNENTLKLKICYYCVAIALGDTTGQLIHNNVVWKLQSSMKNTLDTRFNDLVEARTRREVRACPSNGFKRPLGHTHELRNELSVSPTWIEAYKNHNFRWHWGEWLAIHKHYRTFWKQTYYFGLDNGRAHAYWVGKQTAVAVIDHTAVTCDTNRYINIKLT